jgi:hypothetical protein
MAANKLSDRARARDADEYGDHSQGGSEADATSPDSSEATCVAFSLQSLRAPGS